MSEPGEITLLLQQANQGDGHAADRLFRLVEKELRAIAANRQRQVHQDVTLTGVVDEAFCKLIGQNNTQWKTGDRQKFFQYAATKIHNILVDSLRASQRAKRRNEYQRVGLDFADPDDKADGVESHTLLLDLKTALDEMPPESETDATIFRIRYFLGCTIEETAEIMGVSESEVSRAFQRVRLWLQWAMKSYSQDNEQ